MCSVQYSVLESEFFSTALLGFNLFGIRKGSLVIGKAEASCPAGCDSPFTLGFGRS